jgi:hypothetical protein
MPRQLQAAQFWEIADIFKAGGSPWKPVSLGLEMRRRFQVSGRQWTACYKIHVLLNDDGTGKAQDKLRFKSSITLWPPTDSAAKKALPAEAQWYQRASRLLLSHGYAGEWRDSAWGVFGDFWKDLGDVDAVVEESRLLSRLRIRSRGPAAGADAGRKTERSSGVKTRLGAHQGREHSDDGTRNNR